jgi:hypothetical protein
LRDRHDSDGMGSHHLISEGLLSAKNIFPL